METVEEIIQEVHDEVDAKEYPVRRILNLFNDGLKAVSAGRFAEAQNLDEIFLPSLETDDSIPTDTANPYVAMPATYQKKLLSCYNVTTDSDVIIYDSLSALEEANPGLSETYSVEGVAVSGNNLYYQGIPGTAQTLYLRFFGLPTTLEVGSTPDCLPEHLQKRVLKNYALWHIYRKKEFSLPEKPNSDYYRTEFFKDMADLSLWGGTPYATRPKAIPSRLSINMVE